MKRALVVAAVAGTTAAALLLLVVVEPRRCELLVRLPPWVTLLPLLLALAPVVVAAVRRHGLGLAALLSLAGLALLVLAFDPFGTYVCRIAG